MDEQGAGITQHKIPNVAAGFMIATAILLDLVQFLFDITGFLSPLADLVTFFAMCVFGVWFALFGVSYFGGKKAGMKMLSVFTSVIIELVPIVDALPAITAGVIGIIVSTRLEDRKQNKTTAKETQARVRFSGPQQLPPGSANTKPLIAANDNDTEEEEEYEEAA